MHTTPRPNPDAAPGHASRRQHARISTEVEVSLSSEHNFYTGFTQNISEGGLFVATKKLLPIGTELEFSFKLEAQAQPFQARGVVRWIREATAFTADVPAGMGIQFVDLSPAAQQQVDDFIAQRRETIFYED